MSGFDTFKKQTVENIFGGIDFSTKGYIDHLVSELVRLINHHPDYCTTSSCSGRLVLFFNSQETKGVHWTFVNHGTCPVDSVLDAVKQKVEENTLLVMKVEPFIMHICCRTPEAAKQLHQWSAECGFRESGITLGEKRVMLAIRTTAFQMELPIAKNGELLFPKDYLNFVVEEANEKLRLNFERIDKFVMMLKRNWQWPFFVVSRLLPTYSMNSSKSLLADYHLHRYGAAATLIEVGEKDYKKSVPLLIGGQGQETELKSGRQTSSLYITNKALDPNDFHLLKVPEPSESSMIKPFVHSVIVSLMGGKYIFVSGGRLSPQKVGPILKVYQKESEKRYISESTTSASSESTSKNTKKKSTVQYPQLVECTADAIIQSGEIPEDRWGHIFLPVSETQYFLMGGRSTANIFSDAYLLEVKENEENNKLLCHWQKLNLQLPSSTLLQRCFAAAALIPHPHHCEIRRYLPYVLIHGGLPSLEDYFGAEDMILVDISNNIVLQPPVQIMTPSLLRLQRYGHSLTSIGGKSILMIGGVSDDLQDTDANTNVILDYGVDAGEQLIIRARVITNNQCLLVSEVLENEDKQRVQAISAWPAAQARVHHTTILDAAKQANVHDRLLVVGGGMMSLAFGDHYCDSLVVEISYPRSASSLITMKKSKVFNHCSELTAATENNLSKSNTMTNSIETTSKSFPIILVPSHLTKGMKTLLEKHHFFNKTMKIFSFSLTEEILGSIEMFRIPHEDEALEINENTWIPENGSLVFGIPILPMFTTSLTNSEENKLIPEIYQELTTLLKEPRLYYIPKYTMPQLTNENITGVTSNMKKNIGKKSRQQEMEFLLKEKLLEASESLLQSSASAGSFQGLSEDACANLPHKYEMVGDVMMIPEQSFRHADWIAMISSMESQQSPNTVNHNNNLMLIDHPFWRILAEVFQVHRIARKATIDERPMRESKVILLYQQQSVKQQQMSKKTSEKPCICGEPNHEKNIPGWVTVVENKISFSFDITKVMFCSGNNTERMRFGRLPSQGDVVVDFYAGIGYFTVPLLVYGGVKHLYALEWNPNSIYALRHNLAVNNVSSDRYTILFGDNRITSVEHHLNDIADRISLGLLPTSTDGWPLAVRALKPTGGVLHVHENVHQRDLEQWTHQTCETLMSMFAAAGKPMKITVLHRECVKSYAPRVHHYVLDLQCTGSVDSI